MKESDFFALASKEVQLGKVDRALQARAFAEAKGEHNHAKARYLELRAAELQARYALHRQEKRKVEDDARLAQRLQQTGEHKYVVSRRTTEQKRLKRMRLLPFLGGACVLVVSVLFYWIKFRH
ncbi:hypothetical protein KSF73_12875 [Burkholderiaceae bacterium DAT-1]|nr:hypothetical protein [Burkholderiaceae bacterium DAT-1]